MKVFLDTNVWVSGFLVPGLCEELLDLCLEGGMILSSRLCWDELCAVMNRKARVGTAAIEEIAVIWGAADLIADVPDPADDNDARLVAAAAAAGADLFVTGDRRVLEWQAAGTMRIVSPREAWMLLFSPPTQP